MCLPRRLGGYTYEGHVIPQGHTNRGQLLGASIGPGGEAQFVGVDALADLGVAGLYFERVYRQSHIRGAAYPSTDPDVEVTIGLRGLSRAWKSLAIAGDLSWSERWVDEPQVNWGLDLQIVWLPDLR